MSGNSHTCEVTVLMPVYNAAPFLREAIESILSQTFRDFEFLIINDGSTDQSREIILSFSDSRIRLLDNPGNIGLIATLNRGIREARGKYIVRMDADDISLTSRLEKQVGAMKSDPGIAVLASFVDFINTDGEVTGHWSTDREAVSENEIRSLMMKTNCIAHPSIMMRKEIAEKFLYHPKRKGAEDWDLWMRLLAAGERIAKQPEVLLKYRIHHGSITARDKNEDVLERRLIRFKHRFLWSQFGKLKLNGFFFGVKISLLKNIMRHLVSNIFPGWARDCKRFLTSPPWTVIRQRRKFRELLETNTGRHYFIFPYMHVGGAEKVHAAIVETVSDQKPVVIFSGFSENNKFLTRFTQHATVIDAAHYINYPLTRTRAKRLLAEKLNSKRSVIFGSNAGFFYDIIPMLKKDVTVIDLIHAFKYQPGANLAHRKLLPLASRLDRRIFVSEAARLEFDKFSFHNNIPRALRNRLVLITNAVDVPVQVSVEMHEHPGIMWVGRRSPEKRFGLFILIGMMLTEKYPGKFRSSVVGVSDVEGDIQSYGEIFDDQEMQKIYRKNDFLLLTSSREGFPMVIMEAMSQGLVVISTPVGDVPNRIDASTGIVLSSTEESLVAKEALEAIETLVADQKRMQSMRRNAHQYAVENYSFERFRKEYRELLEA